MNHWILITGPADPNDEESEAARQIGTMLARDSYGLVVGDWPGVDELTIHAFIESLPTEEQSSRLMHIANYERRASPFRVRGAKVIENTGPDPGYSADAVRVAHAGIIISGRRGSRNTMDALLRQQKPVLPIAFLGWDAFEVYREVLSSWNENPVPGLSERQFMELIRPWRYNAKPVSRLLKAALAKSPKIFVSYRHADAAFAAGRMFDELVHLYGAPSVCIDYGRLQIGEEIDTVLSVLSGCSLLVVIIGPNWQPDRLNEPDDYVRRELETALRQELHVLPVLVQRPQPPSAAELPESVRPIGSLLHEMVRIEDWQQSMERLVSVIDRKLS